MKPIIASLILLAVVASACGMGEGLSRGPIPAGRSPSLASSAPTASAESTDAAPPSVAPYAPVAQAPVGILPPDSVARVIANGLRVRGGPPGSPDHDQIVYSLAAGTLVLIGSSPLSYVPPESSSDGRGWYEVHVGGAEVDSYADGGINGWMAEGENGLEWLELAPIQCRGSDTLAGVLYPPDQGGEAHEWATAWDQLACYGGGPLELQGVIEFLCMEGSMLPFDMTPYHLAAPVLCTGLIPDDIDVEGHSPSGLSLGLRFDEAWGAYPARGEVVRISGHFDDPASSTCTFKPSADVNPPPFDPQFLVLFCRERFVVDELTVVGHRDLAPLPWEG